MRASALFSAAAAAVLAAGAARAEISFRFYEGLECRDGAEAMTMTFAHANTVVFGRQAYRTVLAMQREGADCAWKPHYNWTSAQDRPRVQERADFVRVNADCQTAFNGDGQSLALYSIEVYDC